MSRIQSRELAFKLIFDYQFNVNINNECNVDFIKIDDKISLNDESLKNIFTDNNVSLNDEDLDFCKSLVNTYLNNQSKIDNIVESNISGYNINRVYKCDLAILKLAVAELLAYDYDYKIVINASIEIAKKYSDDKSYKFVHSVLSKIIKELYNE